jgi:hypothetical protein
MDWLFASVWLSYIAIYGLRVWEERKHKQEIERIHESYAEERKELLDRIMANNMQEFKTLTNAAPTKKSETGNFLKDRMTKEIMKQFDME